MPICCAMDAVWPTLPGGSKMRPITSTWSGKLVDLTVADGESYDGRVAALSASNSRAFVFVTSVSPCSLPSKSAGLLLLSRHLCPDGFFCASSRRGEWHDSSSCDPPTCHACFPTVGSEPPACYRGRLAVGRPDPLPAPHISWMGVPEWLWERGLPFLVVVSGSA